MIVLLNSGGKDSLAAAMLLRERTLHSLYVHVGNATSDVEEVVSRKIAAKYASQHTTLRLSGGPFEAPSRFGGYMVMPAKAAMLHATGMMFAYTVGAEGLASGQRSDVLRDDFADTLGRLASMSRHRDPMPLIFPLRDIGRDSFRVFEIIRDEPLWRETIYCLSDPACGKCARCAARARWVGNG